MPQKEGMGPIPHLPRGDAATGRASTLEHKRDNVERSNKSQIASHDLRDL